MSSPVADPPEVCGVSPVDESTLPNARMPVERRTLRMRFCPRRPTGSTAHAGLVESASSPIRSKMDPVIFGLAHFREPAGGVSLTGRVFVVLAAKCELGVLFV